jgi:hypothetical protein
LFYPLVEPILLTHDLRALKNAKGFKDQLRIAIHRASRDSPYGIGFWVLTAGTGGVYITGFELLETTESWVPENNSVPIVVVDAFARDDDLMRKGPEFIFKQHEQRGSRVFFVRPKNFKELKSELEKIRAQHGSIGLIDFVSHGAPGFVSMYESGITSSTLRDLEPLKDLMKKGARLRFFNCELGQGDAGEQMANEFGRVFLPLGGSIAMATKPVGSGWADLIIAGLEHELGFKIDTPKAKLLKDLQSPLMLLYPLLFESQNVLGEQAWRNFQQGVSGNTTPGIRIFDF